MCAGANSCHRPAALGAALAFFDALAHVAHLFAALGARLAHFGADGTDPAVQWRTAQHEVSRRLADLGAVEHQPKMLLLDMPPASLEAEVHRRLNAHAVAVETRLDRVPQHGCVHPAHARGR